MANSHYADKTDKESELEQNNSYIVRRITGEWAILLENKDVLPRPSAEIIALFGNIARQTINGGTGSGNANITVKATVKNTCSEYNGKENVQVNVNDPNGHLQNPFRVLVGFLMKLQFNIYIIIDTNNKFLHGDFMIFVLVFKFEIVWILRFLCCELCCWNFNNFCTLKLKFHRICYMSIALLRFILWRIFTMDSWRRYLHGMQNWTWQTCHSWTTPERYHM